MNRFLRVALCVALFSICAMAQKLNGAGATFPYPIYSKWFSEYHKANPSVEINYQSIGSGGGILQLLQGTVDFGASDGPMTDEQLAEAKVKILHVPTVLGSVVPAYNIRGVTQELKFTPDVLAGIFLGKIKNWNDPAIAKVNPGVTFPNQEIVVAHRSDGSGTTYVFTDYLSKVSPEWQKTVGKGTSVKWPSGIGGKGNEGVAGTIVQIQGSIGYIELIYAVQNKIPFGTVQNAAGTFVKASLESTTAAAASAKMPADFRVSITNAPGKNAYPIASFTWLLVPVQSKDAAKGKVLKDYLTWMLDKGEAMTAPLTYAPLPTAVSKMVRAEIQQIH
ncbi:MAG: phosphate ABC transporter substrate-binding protein PstS [Candidatus Korobacteraceae bacterium]